MIRHMLKYYVANIFFSQIQFVSLGLVVSALNFGLYISLS